METEKLTLEHLAPYLPYGLQMINIKSGRIIDVRGLRGPFIIQALIKEGEEFHDVEYHSDLWPFKPLLLPLDKLKSEIEKWLKEHFGEFDIKDWLNVYHIAPRYLPYFICEKIFELHGDLNGLISKNLAIDKSTYKQTL